MSSDIVMTEKEAVEKFVHDGDCLALGGFVTNRRPYAMVREIIRQGIKNLYLEGGPSGGDMDMLIGVGAVTAMNAAYISNAAFSAVCRRYTDAVIHHKILYEDYSMDVQTILYHAAALGLPYVPVKNMLGSDLADKWGISEEERKKHPKLPPVKFLIEDDPFHPGEKLCLIPTPTIDVAIIHAQYASPDGTVRIVGPVFQDEDIAIAARRTIVSYEHLISNEEIRRNPELNTLPGLSVDAVVPLKFGASPSQCFGCYDYDVRDYRIYAQASRTQEDFDRYIQDTVFAHPSHKDWLAAKNADWLLTLEVQPDKGYVPGLNSME
ncbi:MAG: glutaconate CoA-transferase [Lachnospiraceae bacterium]|nr:glutaconate CoA-transferase [Lachnospiraceae bacterium]